jgi:hypothetical protein
MHDISDFIKLIQEQIEFFTDATIIEEQKLKAAKKNRITFIEDAMKKEQAMILKLRGFDKKREEIQADLGFEKLSFSEIIESCDEEKKNLLIPLMNQLNAKVLLFRNTCESAKSIMEINLHTINNLLAQTENTPDNGYSKKGVPNSSKKNFTNRMI